MNTPTWDEYFLDIAKVVATRGTCVRRQVGSVLVSKDNRILATGYNGKARGITNCSLSPCKGANLPTGIGLDKCEAIHAEQNALLYCSAVWKIHTCYTTTAPCVSCLKMLLGTSCKRIVFIEPYENHPEAVEMWKQRENSEWLCIKR